VRQQGECRPQEGQAGAEAATVLCNLRRALRATSERRTLLLLGLPAEGLSSAARYRYKLVVNLPQGYIRNTRHPQEIFVPARKFNRRAPREWGNGKIGAPAKKSGGRRKKTK
jgi:hypothetical protein